MGSIKTIYSRETIYGDGGVGPWVQARGDHSFSNNISGSYNDDSLTDGLPQSGEYEVDDVTAEGSMSGRVFPGALEIDTLFEGLLKNGFNTVGFDGSYVPLAASTGFELTGSVLTAAGGELDNFKVLELVEIRKGAEWHLARITARQAGQITLDVAPSFAVGAGDSIQVIGNNVVNGGTLKSHAAKFLIGDKAYLASGVVPTELAVSIGKASGKKDLTGQWKFSVGKITAVSGLGTYSSADAIKGFKSNVNNEYFFGSAYSTRPYVNDASVTIRAATKEDRDAFMEGVQNQRAEDFNASMSIKCSWTGEFFANHGREEVLDLRFRNENGNVFAIYIPRGVLTGTPVAKDGKTQHAETAEWNTSAYRDAAGRVYHVLISIW